MNFLGKVFDTIRDHVAPKHVSASQKRINQYLLAMQTGQFPSAEDSLRDLLRYARETIPYYRNLHATVAPLTPETLEGFPPLTKDLIRTNFEQLKDPTLSERHHWEAPSGGSTGKPIRVIQDDRHASTAHALELYAGELCYGAPYTNQLILWGSAQEALQEPQHKTLKGHVRDSLLRAMGKKTTTYNTFNFTREKLEDCVRTLNSQKPEFIFGYAGSVYQLAKFIHDNGLSVRRSPKAALLTAQTCYPHMREMIESVLGCQICNHYGSREVGPVSWEAKDGKIYIFDFFAFVEIVDDDNRHVSVGEEGRVLVTTLQNYAMPLIRYDIGDRAVLGPRSSLAGLQLPTFQRIAGKTAEHFKTKSGKLIDGHFFTNIFYFREWIDEFQIIQKKIDEIEVLYKLQGSLNDTEKEEITDQIRKVMGGACEIFWTQVDTIPKTPAGKQLAIRRLID